MGLNRANTLCKATDGLQTGAVHPHTTCIQGVALTEATLHCQANVFEHSAFESFLFKQPCAPNAENLIKDTSEPRIVIIKYST